MDHITLNAHAKINLSLEITGKRPDGYHDIVSFMQGIGLHDVMKIEKCSQKATKYKLPHCTVNGIVVYLCTDAKTIPTDMDNLAFRAVKAFTDAMGATDPESCGLTDQLLIDIRKDLPVSAGIGGGSANAAACLLGLNEMTGRPFSLRQLMEIGAGFGADVPFSTFMNAYRNRDVLGDLEGIDEASDAAWTYGIGEIVEAAESVPKYVIMANPGTAVLTKAAYEAMDAIGYADAASAGKHLFVNDMEKYTLMADPKAANLRKFMQERLDAEVILMSGSGPTMVAYYKDLDKAGKGLAAFTELAVNDASLRAWLTDTGR
jgi:4-diphosphocytidyl-2-C-methyl-D-erythritol kinase